MEILVQSRRKANAAKRFLRKLMKLQGPPRALVTDKLRGYDLAVWDLCSGTYHRSYKGLNKRSEASHRLTRILEKILGKFRSARHLQRLMSALDQITTLLRLKRYRLAASHLSKILGQRLSRPGSGWLSTWLREWRDSLKLEPMKVT